jgi:hypothetical protein
MLIHFLRVIFAIIYSIIGFISFGNSIDGTPFHLTDIAIMLFISVGVIFSAKYSGDFIYEFIQKFRKSGNKT